METPSTPGWYDDPEAADQLRYFDGVVWTRHTAPRTTRWTPPETSAPPAGPTAQVPPAAAGEDPYGWRGPSSAPPPQQTHWGAPPAGGMQQQWGQQPAPYGQQQPGWGPGMGYASGPATPDGVPLAGYWQRVGAYILDILLTGLLSSIFGGYFLLKALRPWIDDFVAAGNSSDDPKVFEDLLNSLSSYLTGRDFLTYVAITILVGLVYNVGFNTWRGATPGKMALRISVRERDKAGPLSLQVALRRYALTLAIAILGALPSGLSLLAMLLRVVDLLFPAFDGRRQALHDKIGGTNVVQGRQPKRAPKTPPQP